MTYPYYLHLAEMVRPAVRQIFGGGNSEQPGKVGRRSTDRGDRIGQVALNLRSTGAERRVIALNNAFQFRVLAEEFKRHGARFVDFESANLHGTQIVNRSR